MSTWISTAVIPYKKAYVEKIRVFYRAFKRNFIKLHNLPPLPFRRTLSDAFEVLNNAAVDTKPTFSLH